MFGPQAAVPLDKLWLYTNFDCNLACSYCVTESSPRAARRALGATNVQRLVEEAAELGFSQVFLTGGEPFLLGGIYEMLAYASARIKSTVLTNGVLLRGQRLEQLCSVNNANLGVQVSLDGARPEHNDVYRGQGTWARAVQGIERLQTRGIHVSISTTETPANHKHLDELRQFVRSLGIAEADHFVRPLTRRGFSREGTELGRHNLLPEVAVTSGGVFWHPAISPRDDDMRVTERIFPLAEAVQRIRDELAQPGGAERTTLT